MNDQYTLPRIGTNKTFYCKNHSGSMESIEEWNEVRKSLEVTNLSEKEKQAILFPKVCNTQCFDCLAEAGERRIETQRLINKTSGRSDKTHNK